MRPPALTFAGLRRVHASPRLPSCDILDPNLMLEQAQIQIREGA